jgi:hypothetical protein
MDKRSELIGTLLAINMPKSVNSSVVEEDEEGGRGEEKEKSGEGTKRLHVYRQKLKENFRL